MPRLPFKSSAWDIEKATVGGNPNVFLGYLRGSEMGLRRLDHNDPYRWAADGEVPATGVFTSPVVRVGALQEIFSVDWEMQNLSEVSQVGIQITVDGTNYLAWDDGEWEIQTKTGIYNSREEFNDHCESLPILYPKKVGVRLKFTRKSDGGSPTLTQFNLCGEFDYHFHLDLYEAVKSTVEDMTFPLEIQKRMPATGKTFPFQSKYPLTTPIDLQVFNLAEDPDQNENLFSSWNSLTKVVTLTVEVEEAETLLLRYRGTAPVVLAQKDEMISLASLPVTVVRMATIELPNRMDSGRTREDKVTSDSGNDKVRIRDYPRLNRVKVEVEHWTTFRPLALKFYREAREALRNLSSPATGELFAIIENTPGGTRESGESFVIGAWSADLVGFHHSRHYEEFKRASISWRMNLREHHLRSEAT